MGLSTPVPTGVGLSGGACEWVFLGQKYGLLILLRECVILMIRDMCLNHNGTRSRCSSRIHSSVSGRGGL